MSVVTLKAGNHICTIMSLLTLCIANCSWWKNFTVEEMNYNLLENIHGCMIVLCTLRKGIIANLLEKFRICQLICRNRKTFLVWMICNVQ